MLQALAPPPSLTAFLGKHEALASPHDLTDGGSIMNLTGGKPNMQPYWWQREGDPNWHYTPGMGKFLRTAEPVNPVPFAPQDQPLAPMNELSFSPEGNTLDTWSSEPIKDNKDWYRGRVEMRNTPEGMKSALVSRGDRAHGALIDTLSAKMVQEQKAMMAKILAALGPAVVDEKLDRRDWLEHNKER